MTAKDKFIQSPHREPFEKVVLTPMFETACDYAMLILGEDMSRTFGNPSNSWDYGCRMEGARKFMEILKTLHEPVTQMKAEKYQTPYHED